MSSPARKVLFVCLGNICRSPAAEGAFRARVEKAGLSGAFTIDSCGTGDWHLGELADERMRKTARRHGIELTHRSRLFTPADLDRFDLVLAMDFSNRDALLRQASGEAQRSKIHLLREYDPESRGACEVPDPYYGGDDGFERVWAMVDRCAVALLKSLSRPAETSRS